MRTNGRGMRAAAVLSTLALGMLAGALGWAAPPPPDSYVVLAANDLGMHCMQPDFSQMMILPPFNTMRAVVIRRGGEPHIVTSGVTVRYTIPGNTRSSDKCNFWTYAPALLGAALAPDFGLTGNTLAGVLRADKARRDWAVVGVPVTPIDDTGIENTYPLALITVEKGGKAVGRAQAVMPVSWEMNCNLCHNTPGESLATDVIKAHDRLHGTHLIDHQPVFCARCHEDPAVGSPGQAGIKSLSEAMHGAHASRMNTITLDNACYACHPGLRTQCLRDVHATAGMTCVDCHGTMADVGSPGRTPWVDLPRCGSCHTRAGFEFEQPGVRYRDSYGHMGVQCYACHGSPHAITPTSKPNDNLQAIRLQGQAGPIGSVTCTVCHTSRPDDRFPHNSRGDD